MHVSAHKVVFIQIFLLCYFFLTMNDHASERSKQKGKNVLRVLL